MLPNKLKTENATVTSNKSEENYYDYDTDDYDDDYNYDDEVALTESTQKAKSGSSTTVKPNRAVNTAAKNSKKVEMKPIKEEKTVSLNITFVRPFQCITNLKNLRSHLPSLKTIHKLLTTNNSKAQRKSKV